LNVKVWSLLTLIIILIIGGGFFLLNRVTILYLENMDHPKNIHIRVNPSEKFSIFYIHSIYGEAVVEEFQIEKDSIILTGVRTKSPAVMEYYGFEDSKDFHLLNKDKKIYLSEIGERGDRIRLRIGTIHLGRYILDEFIRSFGLSY